ncbi:protein of unknown function [Pararobbsia alpina]
MLAHACAEMKPINPAKDIARFVICKRCYEIFYQCAGKRYTSFFAPLSHEQYFNSVNQSLSKDHTNYV